jgi:hypothetical protein
LLPPLRAASASTLPPLPPPPTVDVTSLPGQALEAPSPAVAVDLSARLASAAQPAGELPSSPLAEPASGGIDPLPPPPPTPTVAAEEPAGDFFGRLLPPPLAAAALAAFNRLHTLLADPREWKPTKGGDGVRAYSMADGLPSDPKDPTVGARGDSVLPFPIAVLQHFLGDTPARFLMDPTLDKIRSVKEFGGHARVERLQFKGQLVVAPRDFCALGCWVVRDGALYFFATSVPHAEVPEEKGYVRGNLEVGAWVASPLPTRELYNAEASACGAKAAPEPGWRGGCKVTYLFRTRIGSASLPAWAVKQACDGQALLPAAVGKLLAARYAKGVPPGEEKLFSGPLVNVLPPPDKNDGSVDASAVPVGAVVAAAAAGAPPPDEAALRAALPAGGEPPAEEPAEAFFARLLPDAALAGAATRAFARLRTLFLDTALPGGGKEWSPLGSKDGVRTFTMADGLPSDPKDPTVGARGDSVLPFPVAALQHFIADTPARFKMDPSLDKIKAVAEFAGHARVERLQFKGQMVVAPRDFCTLGCWVVRDGALYFFATSVPHAEVPEEKGYVRGNLEVGAWVASPLPTREEYNAAASACGAKAAPEPGWRGGCKVTYLFRTRIGSASLPAWAVKAAVNEQALLPAAVGKLLAARYAKGVPPGEEKLFSEPLVNVLPAAGGGGAAVTPTAPTAPAAVGAAAAPAPAPADAAPAPAPAATLPYAFNLSGVWALDRATSEPISKVLAAMGVNYFVRSAADGAEVTSEVVHTANGLAVRDKMLVMGATIDEARATSLDGKPTNNVGSDKKTTVSRAFATRAWDALPEGADVEALLAATPAAGALGEGAPLPPPHGPGSGCLVVVNTLPEALGVSVDERHMLSPTRVRLVTTYSKGGVVKARITRFLARWDAAKGARVADGAAPDIVPVFAATAAAPEPPPSAESAAAAVAPADSPRAPPLSPATADAAPRAAVAAPLSPPPPPPPAAAPAVVQLVAALGAQPAPGGYAFDRWIPDESAPACFASGAPFSAFLRRHHCRACGQAFCDAEATARLPLAHFTGAQLRAARLVASEAVRLCSGCAVPAVFTVSRVQASGGRVTLTGAHLGSSDLVAAGRVDVVVGGLEGGKALRARGLTAPVDHTALSFLMPPGTGLRSLRVTVEGRSSVEVPFWYLPPALTAAEPLDTDGGPTLVRGDNLGVKLEDAAALAWAFNGEAVRPLAVGGGGVVLALPAGTGAGPHALTVAARAPPALAAALPAAAAAAWGGPLAGASLQLGYAPPTLFSGRLSAGAVAIYGRSLGARAEDVRVCVAGVPLPPSAVAMQVPHAKLLATLSDAAAAAVAAANKAGTAVRVEVAVAGQDAEEPLLI